MPNARRALLLFAVVLAVSALVAAVTQRDDERAPPPPVTEETPRASARPSHRRVEPLTFRAGTRPRERSVRAGESATVVVAVPRSGQVELRGLDQVAAADAVTPANFAVELAQAGRYRVLFTPAGTTEATEAGTLVVKP